MTSSALLAVSASKSTPSTHGDSSVASLRSASLASATTSTLYNSSNSNENDRKMIAKRVSASPTSPCQCGERLRSGNLVSFPTETVYGLGCHALDPIAVQRVFDAKERPLSDPLIVHVTKAEDALELWAASTSNITEGAQANFEENQKLQHQSMQQLEKQALTVLTRAFFPGPLTVVARAHPNVPQILMAHTGFVACRSPSHMVARLLIDASGVPIAAPSANKFGHVSPTKADHVLDDLGEEDVWVIDPLLGASNDGNENGMREETEAARSAVCQVGVESTVAKVEMNAPSASSSSAFSDEIVGSITILRHGAVSSQSIIGVLDQAGLSKNFVVSDAVRYTSVEVQSVAPGQTVKHYSPNVPCFMIDASRQMLQKKQTQNNLPPSTESTKLSEKESALLSKSVIIDYGGRLSHYQPHALAYRDLSAGENPSEAASSVFEILRWSETVAVPELILEKNARCGVVGAVGEAESAEKRALALAVKDKLMRAASGIVINIFQ